MTKKVAIIGAGPAGSYAAYLLAKSGFIVDVFEEHKSIGVPVQCTGLVSSEMNKVLKIPETVIKKRVSQVSIFSPNGGELELKFREPDIVLDRAAFDSWIAEMAAKEGAVFHLNNRFMGFEKGKGLLSKIKCYADGSTRIFQHSYVIGADGPKSLVAKKAGLLEARRFMWGVQARVQHKNDGRIKFFPHIGCFAWCVPESDDVCRVGMVAHDKNHLDIFGFIQDTLKIDKSKIIDRQGGLIPLFNPEPRISKDNIFLIGDAAGLVKATTGGGIIPGLKSAGVLAECIQHKKDYNKEIQKRMHKELRMHLSVRMALDNFSRNDWDSLVKMCSTKNVKKVLGDISRDNLKEMAPKLFFANPALVKFWMKMV